MNEMNKKSTKQSLKEHLEDRKLHPVKKKTKKKKVRARSEDDEKTVAKE
jgi:hypothetical protein